MKKGLGVLLGVVAVILLIAVSLGSSYNNMVRLSENVDSKYSDISVQLKRRADLIPNLVETVKGYAKHEKNTLTEVIEARNKFVSAGSINEEIKANNQLTGALNKLFALSESYPELKANQNFISLQNDLKDTEDKISYARQFYNDTVLTYNNLVQMFPSNIIANMFKFEVYEFFKIEEKEKEVPKVSFE